MGALTPTDLSAMFGNLEPEGLAHRERPGRACFFQRVFLKLERVRG